MKELPDAIYFDCPDCDDITIHDVLKGKMGKSSMDGTIRCQDCGLIRTTTVKFSKPVDVKLMISSGGNSESSMITLEDDDLLKVGDEFNTDDGHNVKITALELTQDKRVKTARATEIKVIWAIEFDSINVKVSINDDRKTYSKTVPSEPGTEFTVGSILSFDDMDCLVHSIMIEGRMLRRGTAEARNIKRIYGKYKKRSYQVLDLEDEV